MNGLIIVYMTFPSQEKAEETADYLIKTRLIVCANILHAKSLYRWHDQIAKENEVILIAKTIECKYVTIEEEVMQIHPYSVPCILKFSVQANEKYAAYVKSEVNKK